jgi:hypothetical protein
VVASSNRGKYKLVRVDPVVAIANDNDSVEVCQTASSGKENNKRSKITKATAKKTTRVGGGGNKLALQTEMYKEVDAAATTDGDDAAAATYGYDATADKVP